MAPFDLVSSLFFVLAPTIVASRQRGALRGINQSLSSAVSDSFDSLPARFMSGKAGIRSGIVRARDVFSSEY
jgi:hypothetical protein